MIYTAVNDFYLSQSELNASASRADGVSAPLEAQLRRYGCDAIAEAVVLLHLPQSVACTAQVLLHRFYCKRSLTRFDIKITAMASAWLAAKLEEVIEIDSFQPLRLRDIIMVFYRVFRRKDNKYVDFIYPGTSRYDVIKTEVVRTERHMLRAFGFIVNVEHPHRFVLTFGQLLGLERDVLQVGWTLANDTLRSTTLCVRYRAEIVACGILYVAAKRSSTPMPEHPPWWRVFIGGSGSEEVLAAVVREIIEVEKLPRAEYVVLVKDYTSRGVGVPGAASPPPPFAPAPVPMPAQTTTIVKPQVCYYACICMCIYMSWMMTM